MSGWPERNCRSPHFRWAEWPPLAEGFTAAGFRHPPVDVARNGASVALPDDVVVAVVPVAGEWGQVTKFGSIVVSAAVAADTGR